MKTSKKKVNQKKKRLLSKHKSGWFCSVTKPNVSLQEYSGKQLISLVSCMAHIQKKVRQRLIQGIEEMEKAAPNRRTWMCSEEVKFPLCSPMGLHVKDNRIYSMRSVCRASVGLCVWDVFTSPRRLRQIFTKDAKMNSELICLKNLLSVCKKIQQLGTIVAVEIFFAAVTK